MTNQSLDAEAIESAAYGVDTDRVFCDGFRHGARWAEKQIGAEVQRLQAENERLRAGLASLQEIDGTWLFSGNDALAVVDQRVGELLDDGATAQAEDAGRFNYFRECIGESYQGRSGLGKHEAQHPATVRAVMAEFAGTRAADVIAALVWRCEIEAQRGARAGEEAISLRQKLADAMAAQASAAPAGDKV